MFKFFLLSVLVTGTLFAARTPEERKQLFSQATEKLKQSGIEKEIPKKGALFPDLNLKGKKVSELVQKGPLIVTFYRGGWCPYCVKQLKEINQSLSALKDRNAQLIAISPEKEQEVQKTKKKNNLDFQLIADHQNALAKKLGLVFKVDDEVVKEYKALGIDLAASQGNQDNQIPIPATFVIGQDRKIKYVFADADYTQRASVSDILKALE
jgi:peroxiredoxin